MDSQRKTPKLLARNGVESDKHMSIELLHIDCMAYMKDQPDNAFDLAIVDPQYGIGLDKGCDKGTVGKYGSKHEAKDWDSEIPNAEYWEQLFRVSKHQIVWGGNYFTEYLPPTKSWIIWDKKQPAKNFAACEIAWTSTDKRMDIYRYAFNIDTGKIHPTQKPVKLYEWLLTNYAEPGQRIVDTHLGSGSSAIAAHYFGVDFVGCEIDEDYYKAAVNRFENETAQLALL